MSPSGAVSRTELGELDHLGEHPKLGPFLIYAARAWADGRIANAASARCAAVVRGRQCRLSRGHDEKEHWFG